MAKRLVDTNKHKDPWWKSLSTNHKILFDFMSLDCDHAGFWKINFDTFDLLYKIKMDVSDMSGFGKKIVRIDEETYFLTSFIKVQYGHLNPSNNAHRGVINLLNYYNIEISPYLAPAKLLTSPCEGAQDKDMVKEKEKVKEKEVKTNGAQKITVDLLINLFNKTCAGHGSIEPFNFYALPPEALTNFINRSGEPAYQRLEQWTSFFEEVLKSDFLLGKKTGFVASLPWLLKPDKFVEVATGVHRNREPEKSNVGDPRASGAEADKLFDGILRRGFNNYLDTMNSMTDVELRAVEIFGGSARVFGTNNFTLSENKMAFRPAYRQAVEESELQGEWKEEKIGGGP